MLTTFLYLALLTVVHLGLVLLAAPLLLGIVNRVKALFAGRVGPPLLQLYWDLGRLWRKEAVYSRSTTWVFLAGPLGSGVVGILAALLLPFGGERAPLSFPGDLVLLVYLFGLSRFFTVLAALDTGSSFEGMGAAREVGFAVLAETALFLGFAALVGQTGLWSLSPMLARAGQSWGVASGALILILAAWLIVFLVENCRIPFDDPNTHLELTMIHEVMVLDHSGPALGLVLYGASLKFFVLGALVVKLCLGSRGVWWLDWSLFLAGMLGLSVVVGVVESVMARLKLSRVPQLLVAAVLSGMFGFLMVLLKPSLR